MENGYGAVTVVLFSVYLLALLFLFLYGCEQLHLVYKYLRHKKRTIKEVYPPLASFPFVTVQLPVYNEALVIERLIDAVAAFDYPADRFEVQVLDDSTDETTGLIAARVAYYQSRGFAFRHIRLRTGRAIKQALCRRDYHQQGGNLLPSSMLTLFRPKTFCNVRFQLLQVITLGWYKHAGRT